MDEPRRPDLKTRLTMITVALLVSQFLLMGTSPVQAIQAAHPIVGMGVHPSGNGYWVVGSEGGIFTFGNIPFYGSTGGMALNQPIVGMGVHPSGNGYWLVAADGGIFTFGNIPFFGSTGGMALNQPIVGMGVHPSGNGYWLVAADGGIFTFGNIPFFGSTGGMALNRPIVGIGVHPSGNGYWLVAADGGIFTFGSIPFYGSTGGMALNQPIVGMGPATNGNGYWLVAADGGIFTFGSIPFHGSTGAIQLAQPIVGMGVDPLGEGYWLVARDGGIFAFNVPYLGSVPGINSESPPPVDRSRWIDQDALEHPLVMTSTSLNNLFLPAGDGTSFRVIGNGGHPNGPGFTQDPSAGDCSGVGTRGLAIDDAYETSNTDLSRNSFDNGATVWINRDTDADPELNNFDIVSPTSVDVADRHLRSGPHDVQGIQITIHYYAAAQSATLRTVVKLTNSLAQYVTPTVAHATNLGSDGRSWVTRTQNGNDNLFDGRDRWAVTTWTDQDGSRQEAVMTNVFAGPGHSLTTGTFSTSDNSLDVAGDPGKVFECNTRDGIGTSFEVPMAPGAIRSLMFFQSIYQNDSAAIFAATSTFDSTATLTPDLLAGLSAADLTQVANWKFDFPWSFAAGPGIGGGPRAKSFGVAQPGLIGTSGTVLPFDPAMRGGVSVALADAHSEQGENPNSFGVPPETLVAPGPGAPPDIKIYATDRTNWMLRELVTQTIGASRTYGDGFNGGVHVTTGRLDATEAGRSEIIIAPMSGAARIKVFRYKESTKIWEELTSFFAYSASYTGGMTIAAGDVDGDFRQEIIVGGGPGASPQVRIFKVSDAGDVSEVAVEGQLGFNPFPGWSGAVNVASAKFTADDAVSAGTRDEIVTSKEGSGADGHVKISRFQTTSQPMKEVFSWISPFNGGVRVAAGDVNEARDTKRRAELILGAAPGVDDPWVRIYTLDVSNRDSFPPPTLFSELLAYNAGFRGGVRVAAPPLLL